VRQAPEPSTTPAPPKPSDFNLAEDVDENYPIIFNILLFVGISLLITTLAICVAIATMDPGRDSLIYRVTSAQRFKKDN
jgi:renin receptor